MILHCKNAEMTIILSFLHFYSVKSYNFCYFFFNIYLFFFKSGSFFTSEEIKKVKNRILFFFIKRKNLGRRIRKPRNKKKNRLSNVITALRKSQLVTPN